MISKSTWYSIEDEYECKYRELIKKKPKKMIGTYLTSKIKSKKELNRVYFSEPIFMRAMFFYNYLIDRKKLEYDSSPDKWLEANMVSISKNDKDLMALAKNNPNTFYNIVNYLVDNGFLLKLRQGVYFFSPEYVDFLNKKQKEQMRLDESQKLVDIQLKYFEAYMAKQNANK